VPEAEKKTDANASAKEIVNRANALPGIGACVVTFEDGLSLAGNLPEDVQVGGLCAMAPSVLQRMNRHTADTKLGPLTSMTLHCRESQISFFMKGVVCLTVLHAGGDLASETHQHLAEMADELSRTYSQPETAHVDH
jgi:predicted regulator of Ras-like GTPase activity (Roadblock/LC7/MglB family)